MAVRNSKLSELNDRSCKTAAFNLRATLPQKISFSFKNRTSGQSHQGDRFQCRRVGQDLHVYVMAQFKGTEADVDTAMQRFSDSATFTFRRIAFLSARDCNPAYNSCPKKDCIDLRNSTVAPLAGEAADLLAHFPAPPTTIGKAVKIKQTMISCSYCSRSARHAK